MIGTSVRAVVVDFDGTVCPNDVSEELLERFAEPGWKDVDLAFQRGEIGSRECLVTQAGMLRVVQAELQAFSLEHYAIDPTFGPFTRWARRAGMRVAVASDGLGFYIPAMLAAGGASGVEVFMNSVVLGDGDPRIDFPWAHERCVGCGTCKMGVVRRFRRDVGPVAFVGDGHTDRFGALYADLVFAKDSLVDLCRDAGIAYLPWVDFEDVRAGIEAGAPWGIEGPETCPGWTEPTDRSTWAGPAPAG